MEAVLTISQILANVAAAIAVVAALYIQKKIMRIRSNANLSFKIYD